jgi:hypothetical protein
LVEKLAAGEIVLARHPTRLRLERHADLAAARQLEPRVVGRFGSSLGYEPQNPDKAMAVVQGTPSGVEPAILLDDHPRSGVKL